VNAVNVNASNAIFQGPNQVISEVLCTGFTCTESNGVLTMVVTGTSFDGVSSLAGTTNQICLSNATGNIVASLCPTTDVQNLVVSGTLSLPAPGPATSACQFGTSSFDSNGRFVSCTNGSAPVTSVTGTAGQIVANASSGPVQLSLPSAGLSLASFNGTTMFQNGAQVLDSGSLTSSTILLEVTCTGRTCSFDIDPSFMFVSGTSPTRNLVLANPDTGGNIFLQIDGSNEFFCDASSCTFTASPTIPSITAPFTAAAGGTFAVLASGGSTSLFSVGAVANTANSYDIITAATGGVPILLAAGSDTNIEAALASKGTAPVVLAPGNSVIALSCTTAVCTFSSAPVVPSLFTPFTEAAGGGFNILTSDGQLLFAIGAVAGATNTMEIITSSGTPLLFAAGPGANIGIALGSKGTSPVQLAPGNSVIAFSCTTTGCTSLVTLSTTTAQVVDTLAGTSGQLTVARSGGTYTLSLPPTVSFQLFEGSGSPPGATTSGYCGGGTPGASGVPAEHYLAITAATGTCTAGGTITVTLSLTTPPSFLTCSLTPMTAAAAALMPNVFITYPSATQYILHNAAAPTASAAYQWTVRCGGFP
jgi:hypothetical protein